LIDPLLLTTARLGAFDRQRLLTNASSFFFERHGRLFLVTSRHVMIDEAAGHFPDRSGAVQIYRRGAGERVSAPQDMHGHRFLHQRRTDPAGHLHVFGEPMFDVAARYRFAKFDSRPISKY